MTAWNKYIKEAFLNGLTFDQSGKYSHRFVLIAREQVSKAECWTSYLWGFHIPNPIIFFLRGRLLATNAELYFVLHFKGKIT